MEPASKTGKVFIVGAGPGDPGLLTLRGLECLRMADTVLYDGLANPKILVHAGAKARLISVGKHGQSQVWKQSQIDDKLVELALLGQVVVRLKGGDPAIFARTAEELDRLHRESIPFEVVPGITAAQCASSYAGIPLTHRDWASAVAFVTGQQQSDGGTEAEEPLDWDSLARFPGTLVLYMGVTTTQHWSQQLMHAGKSPSTPIAFIRRCSLSDQQVVQCVLRDAASTLASLPLFRPPVITIIGRVTSLAKTFDWFSKRPLFGIRILVCRPEHQTADLVRSLEDLGADVLVQPAIRIEPLDDFTELDDRLRELGAWNWIVFSSQNGVDHFFARLHSLGFDARQFAKAKLAAVGPHTANAISNWHAHCDLQPTEIYNADGLADALQPHVANQRVLLVEANRSGSVLRERLSQTAASVDSVIAYQSFDIDQPDSNIRPMLESSKINYTVVTSSAAGKAMVKMFGDSLRNSTIAAISSKTSLTLCELGYPVKVVSSENSSEGIVQAILKHAQQRNTETLDHSPSS